MFTRAMPLVCLVCSLAFAGAGGAGDAPLLTLEQAVAKAKDHAKEKKVELSRQYLQSAEFNPMSAAPKTTGRCWMLRWQVPRAKGGTTFINVCEDGRVDVEFGE
ncbi:MAG: hypothetical protein Q8L14_07430 [Myxococcales bacterium]|nr:hypothetical protein [Myxococcales bacterium]